MSPYEILQTRRRELSEFEEKAILPSLALSEHERDKLGFAGIAKRVSEPELRKRYCELAVALLDANINYYRADATRTRATQINHTAVIASTLIAAGFAYYFAGPVAALLVSGVWYWLAAETSRRTFLRRKAEADAHNAEVSEWAETVRGWEAERKELSAM